MKFRGYFQKKIWKIINTIQEWCNKVAENGNTNKYLHVFCIGISHYADNAEPFFESNTSSKFLPTIHLSPIDVDRNQET